MTKETSSFAGAARRWRGQLVQVAAIVLLVLAAKGAVAEQFYVPSPSMEPTLLIGDALLASKYPYGYGAASLPIHASRISLPGRLERPTSTSFARYFPARYSEIARPILPSPPVIR